MKGVNILSASSIDGIKVIYVKVMNKPDGKYIAVIDTETTWNDKVMSIGMVIADSSSFKSVDKKYYILSPEYKSGGMYSGAMLIKEVKVDLKESRYVVLKNLIDVLH